MMHLNLILSAFQDCFKIGHIYIIKHFAKDTIDIKFNVKYAVMKK